MSLALENVQKNAMCFKWVQGFCPLKIKITQFPDGFCLKTSTSVTSHSKYFPKSDWLKAHA